MFYCADAKTIDASEKCTEYMPIDVVVVGRRGQKAACFIG